LSVRISIFTQLSVVINAADCEIHHAVLGKTIAFTVSSAVHFGVWALFLGYQCIEIRSLSKIQTNNFPHCTIKASTCKITQAKTKDNSGTHRNLPGWKNWRYFNQRIQVTSPFLYQVNFSALLLEDCFQLLSVTLKIICTFQTCRPFEGFLLNSCNNILTLHYALCWGYISASDTYAAFLFMYFLNQPTTL